MRGASPKSVATHYATYTAFALSAVAAPFVPEVMLAFAGIQYLRGFLYGSRQWRAPARVPLHLGRRGYRDETTRKRGAATWPIGTVDDQQLWLLKEDLAQGCSFRSDNPEWHAQTIERMVFGACLNQMGVVIIQDYRSAPIAGRIRAVASAFGRDTEITAIDLGNPLTTPLRITTEALTLALPDTGQALHKALDPIIEMIGTRHRKDALSLYSAFLDPDALEALTKGQYEIDGVMIDAHAATPSDAIALEQALAPLRAMSASDKEAGREALAPCVQELACMPGLSLTGGLELGSALVSRRLTVIRPSSSLTATLAIILCADAMNALPPASAANVLAHVSLPSKQGWFAAQALLAAAAKAGAIGSIAIPATPSTLARNVNEFCRVRFEQHTDSDDLHINAVVTLKDCQFTRNVLPFSVS